MVHAIWASTIKFPSSLSLIFCMSLKLFEKNVLIFLETAWIILSPLRLHFHYWYFFNLLNGCCVPHAHYAKTGVWITKSVCMSLITIQIDTNQRTNGKCSCNSMTLINNIELMLCILISNCYVHNGSEKCYFCWEKWYPSSIRNMRAQFRADFSRIQPKWIKIRFLRVRKKMGKYSLFPTNIDFGHTYFRKLFFALTLKNNFNYSVN